MEAPAILVADDNHAGRLVVALYLKKFGFKIVEAATGDEALKAARTTRPDLVLLDLSMPELSGDEVTAQLKTDPATRDIPVILMTALPKYSLAVKRAMRAGAEELLFKPFLFKDLAKMIGRYMKIPRAAQF